MEPFDEARLLALAKKGDDQAFVDLLTPCDATMRQLAFRLLGSAAAMDDALQESYIKAFKAIHTFEGNAKFSTWLYSIVYRTCLDVVKHRNRRREVGLDLVSDNPTPNHFDDELVASNQLHNALQQLPDDQRVTVLLVDGEGLSYTEASIALGVTVGTIGSRISRARQSLRTTLRLEDEAQ